MMKGLYTAASGMKVQQINVDVIANNLANVNTAGYKRTQADFQDLLYVILRDPGAQAAGGGGFASPSGVQIGSGAELVSTTKIFNQGDLEQTEQPLNVAIMGDGFFQVDLPNGQKAYTRDGGFRLDAQGNLVTAQGLKVSPAINVPVTSDKSISIAPDGTVSTQDSNGNPTNVGNLKIVRFPNPTGLRSAGSNLLLKTESSGDAQEFTPGENGSGTLSQGFLERSNVSVVNELVNLITAQRAYEVNSRAIKVGDEMLADASNLVR